VSFQIIAQLLLEQQWKEQTRGALPQLLATSHDELATHTHKLGLYGVHALTLGIDRCL
jgi:hypothetical protein